MLFCVFCILIMHSFIHLFHFDLSQFKKLVLKHWLYILSFCPYFIFCIPFCVIIFSFNIIISTAGVTSVHVILIDRTFCSYSTRVWPSWSFLIEPPSTSTYSFSFLIRNSMANRRDSEKGFIDCYIQSYAQNTFTCSPVIHLHYSKSLSLSLNHMLLVVFQ